MRKQIRKATSGTLSLYDLEGFAGNVKVTIYKENAEWKAETTLTPSSVASTLSVDANRRSSTLTVVSGTGFTRGQTVTVVAKTGVRFNVNIIGVQGNVLTLESPLTTLVEADSQVVENVVTLTLSASETASEARDLRAMWSYTNGLGKPINVSRYFDVVLDPWEPNVSAETLSHIDPTVNEYLGGNVSLAQSVAGAKETVETTLRAAGKIPDLYRYHNDLDYVVSLYTLATLNFSAKNFDVAGVFRERAALAIKNIMGSQGWYDLNENMVKEKREERSPIKWARVG